MFVVLMYGLYEKSMANVTDRLSILVFPLMFVFLRDKVNDKVLKTILCLTLVAPLICIADYIIIAQDFFTTNYSQIGEDLHIHRPYFGIILGVSILMSMYLVKYRKVSNRARKQLILFVGIYFIFMIYFYVKMALLCLVGVGSIYAMYLLKQKLLNKRGLITLSVAVLLLAIFIKPIIGFVGDHMYFQYILDLVNGSSIAPRLATWSIGLDLLKENWFAGLGVDKLDALMLERTKLLPISWYEGLGVHMTPLNQWLSFGVFGFALYMLMMSVPFWYKLNDDVLLWRVVIVFFFLTSLTESVLSRHWGIVYYSFINGLLYLNYKVNLKREID